MWFHISIILDVVEVSGQIKENRLKLQQTNKVLVD